ncbi:MAG: ATP-binding protein [Candidatus Latescibacterota bacterium]
MKLRLPSMTVGLACGITAAVAIACGLGAYLFSRHHFGALLETARQTALVQSEMIRVALEHQMMEKDRSLIDEMVRSFAKEPRVQAVVLLDRTGQARYSSVPLEGRTDLTPGSPTCQACHRFPPAQRASSRVIETAGTELLRTVVPIPNRQACHACHDPGHRINGVLIVDMDAGEIRAALNREVWWMAMGSGALVLVQLAAIGLVVRVVVMRRLRRFETAARLIAGGDLAPRVPVEGRDTVSWLAREFNSMADSMAGLVHEVREQRERLETVINSIDDGIVVLSAERTIIAANDAFLQRVGLSRERVTGTSCRHAAPGMCSPADCPTLACLATGERQVRICERRTAQGEACWEEVHASPIRSASGRIAQVVEVWRDISRRREAEAQLAESHRLASLGLLASGFSHELNTPLATVLACVEGILATVPSPGPEAPPDRERIADNARTAREQVLRCRGITQHFLRLSSGKGSPTEIVDLEPSLTAVARLIAPTARAQSVTVEVEPVDPQARVRANEAELQHVLLNLLLNAVQACGPQGKVSLSVVNGSPARIRVTDNGCGIARDDQQRIFEPFLSLRKGGTGLGLYLSLNFVRRWGGDLRVVSAPGQGSTFEVILPAVGADMPVVEQVL